MAKTLILDNEQRTEIDITGVTSFDVIGNPGSLKWTVRAIIGSINRDLITYETWQEAHHAQKSLTDHVIRDDVDTVVVHEDTGSIVPQ